MEGKRKVKVKFGMRWYWSPDELKDIPYGRKYCMDIAIKDAKARLVNKFPQVENIETETRISSCTNSKGMKKMSVQASAFGYVPKCNNSTRHIIKDIRSTKLYQYITEKMNMTYPRLFGCTTEKIDKDNITVVAYVLRYFNIYNANHYIEFSGKGGIPWEQLKDAINVHNQVELDTGLREKDLLLINPDELYIDFKLAKGHWDGNIILSDGSWIEISLSVSKVEQAIYNTIERHCPPKLDIPDSRFEVTYIREKRGK